MSVIGSTRHAYPGVARQLTAMPPSRSRRSAAGHRMHARQPHRSFLCRHSRDAKPCEKNLSVPMTATRPSPQIPSAIRGVEVYSSTQRRNPQASSPLFLCWINSAILTPSDNVVTGKRHCRIGQDIVRRWHHSHPPLPPRELRSWRRRTRSTTALLHEARDKSRC